MTDQASTGPAGRGSDLVLERLMALHPKVIDLSLERMERILEALGHPERNLPPVVHVAGTNGKGSVIAMLRAMLEAEGKRVHVYTSPHLVRFHERIRLAGELIAEADLLALLEECETANAGAPITFFEITTAAAFLAFSRAPADVLLLEVGLGGRLDATNLVDHPALSVITPVSMDHMQFLGPTLAGIAAEKAGILKAGTPAVIAPQPDEAMAAIRGRADQLGVVLSEVAPEMTAAGFRLGADAFPQPGLPGRHQRENAAVAVAAARALGLSETSVLQGLKTVSWPARLQRLTSGPALEALGADWELWLDGGHNAAAGEALAEAAKAWGDRPLGVVYGMLNTKAAQAFLAPLAAEAQAFRAIAIPGEPNSLTAEEAAGFGLAAGAPAQPAANLRQAALELAAELPSAGRILICGSLYLAGQVLRDHA
jgi:dihydrofolate synthase/folylpolyglutamate synthase